MSASDHLSGKQFALFHGTNKEIKGNFVNPSKQRGDEWDGDGPHAAFASDRIDVAAQYGQHVYEVHPTGSEENYGSNVFASNEGFKVKRKVSDEEIKHHVNVVGPKLDDQKALNHRKWLGENNMESWSVEGDNHYHLRYDKEGNEYKTKVNKPFGRPGE